MTKLMMQLHFIGTRKPVRKPEKIDDYCYCEKCDYKTKNIAGLRSHVSNKHSHPLLDENGLAQCNKCGRKYAGAGALTYHKSHCGKPRHLRCKLCTYRSRFKPNMRKHLKSIHKLNEATELDKVMDEIGEIGRKFLKGRIKYLYLSYVVTKSVGFST